MGHKKGLDMTEKQIKKLADDVWKQISSAHHWGDGFNDAYSNLHAALREAAGKKKISYSKLLEMRKSN